MRLQNIIRRAAAAETEAVKALVRSVVDEIYGHLWDVPPFTLDDEDWSRALVAIIDGHIAGIILTQDSFISDLWVLAPFRSMGIGGVLLASAEAEIAANGYREASLCVVEANRRAVAFYTRHGWRMTNRCQHETLPVTLLDMEKTLAPLS